MDLVVGYTLETVDRYGRLTTITFDEAPTAEVYGGLIKVTGARYGTEVEKSMRADHNTFVRLRPIHARMSSSLVALDGEVEGR